MMMDESISFRAAQAEDIPALRSMYNDIIDVMDASRWHAQWRRDGYPTDEDLSAAAQRGELYLALHGAELVGAMVLNHDYNPGYDAVEWQVNCPRAQVLCIHTLGVSPNWQRKGVASAMVNYAAQLARRCACRCLRLDVIDTNRPADLFYSSLGFSLRGRQRLHYDSVSAEFNLYELVL